LDIVKPLKGFGGAGVLELIEDARGSTYRAVYTMRFRDAIYVPYVFQKKSKHGITTPKHEIDFIHDRLKLAQDHYATEKGKKAMSKTVEKSKGNVFADLGLADAEQELLKAKLTLQVHRLLKTRNLTQAETAKLLGTTQPQVSALAALKPTSVSVGRLMEFLTILGQDVEVTVRPAPVSAQAM
jgi:predicted XRE-type DNA-binding protein